LSQGSCLVTGATGAIGPSVVRALHQTGYQVRTFSLDAPEAGLLPDAVDVRTGDVTDRSAVETAIYGCDFVVHLANPTSALPEKYERVNIGGTDTIAAAALRAQVKRVVLFSTITIYGDSGGLVLDENSPPNPGTVYARTKLEAERILLDAKRPNGQPLGTVLRLAAVYGPRMKGNYRRLVRSLARHRFVPLGDGRNRRTLIYEADMAQAAVLAVHHPAAAGKIYNVTDGQYYPMREIIRVICRALGRRPPRISLPVILVRWAGRMFEDAARLMARSSPVGRATIEKYTEDLAVTGQRIQKELGFAPEFGIAEGWRQTVLKMREAGEL